MLLSFMVCVSGILVFTIEQYCAFHPTLQVHILFLGKLCLNGTNNSSKIYLPDNFHISITSILICFKLIVNKDFCVPFLGPPSPKQYGQSFFLQETIEGPDWVRTRAWQAIKGWKAKFCCTLCLHVNNKKEKSNSNIFKQHFRAL